MSADTFGSRLQSAREAAGLTQEQVADALGLHAAAVSQIERGRREPKVHLAKRLADAVGVPLDSLVPAPTPPNP